LFRFCCCQYQSLALIVSLHRGSVGVGPVRQLRLPAVRIGAGSFPAAAQERITSIAILPVIGSVEIFRRLGLSAAAKEPPRVHAVATLLP
jgi:hypothetical protein